MNTGSLNFKQLAGDATNLFNRAVQFTSEQIVGGEKTEYDSQLATLIKTADNTKDWTEKASTSSTGQSKMGGGGGVGGGIKADW